MPPATVRTSVFVLRAARLCSQVPQLDSTLLPAAARSVSRPFLLSGFVVFPESFASLQAFFFMFSFFLCFLSFFMFSSFFYVFFFFTSFFSAKVLRDIVFVPEKPERRSSVVVAFATGARATWADCPLTLWSPDGRHSAHVWLLHWAIVQSRDDPLTRLEKGEGKKISPEDRKVKNIYIQKSKIYYPDGNGKEPNVNHLRAKREPP